MGCKILRKSARKQVPHWSAAVKVGTLRLVSLDKAWGFSPFLNGYNLETGDLGMKDLIFSVGILHIEFVYPFFP